MHGSVDRGDLHAGHCDDSLRTGERNIDQPCHESAGNYLAQIRETPALQPS